MKRLRTHVAVLGGGIVGSSKALALRRVGVDVVLIERDLCGSRSSGINYGGVRRQGRTPAQLPLSLRAHEIWGRLEALTGTDGEYERTGHLKLARSEADMGALETYRARVHGFGLGLEILTGAQLRRSHPWLGTKVVGGSLCPDDGQANPRLVSPAFARAAAQQGATVIERCGVEEFEHDGHAFVLRSPGGLEVRADILVNCAGAWAASVAARFGDAVPMVVGHPAMSVTEPLPYFLGPSLGVEGGGAYARQVRRGNAVFGGAAGVAIAESRARSTTPALHQQTAQLIELVPGLRHAHVIRTWSGTEGYPPDRQPVLGPSPRTPGLFHGFGFAGTGFQIGPAAGEVLAELVHRGRTPTPIDAFAADRFAASTAPVTAGPH